MLPVSFFFKAIHFYGKNHITQFSQNARSEELEKAAKIQKSLKLVDKKERSAHTHTYTHARAGLASKRPLQLTIQDGHYGHSDLRSLNLEDQKRTPPTKTMLFK